MEQHPIVVVSTCYEALWYEVIIHGKKDNVVNEICYDSPTNIEDQSNIYRSVAITTEFVPFSQSHQ